MLYPLKAIGYLEASSMRRFETRDLARRLGAISPNQVRIENYPVKTPLAVFNASGVLVDNSTLRLYARVIIGYYMYVSAIGEMDLEIPDVLSGRLENRTYSMNLVITPSNRYDIWGCEDPRTYRIGKDLYMTYTGRTVNYFRKLGQSEGTFPVTAVYDSSRGMWVKKYVHVQEERLRSSTLLDKDAFLLDFGGRVKLFHRPVVRGDWYYLVVSDPVIPITPCEEPCEVLSANTVEVMPPAPFEEKLGWSCPVETRGSKAVVLVHGVDRDLTIYRVLAVEVSLSRDGVVVNAVTPYYIMEPKTLYETYGDRPFVVFPCGAITLDDKVLVIYGGADSVVGLALIDRAELYSALDRGRLY